MRDTSHNKKPVKQSKKTSKIITENHKKRDNYYSIILVLLAIFSIIIVLYLFSNKTFLKKKYINNDIQLDIPMFTYFISDNNNEVTFKTLKKEKYIKEFFDEYLSNLDNYDYYVCKNGNSFYYNENTKTVIKKVDIKKSFILKTIKIKYEKNNIESLCM